MQPGGEGQARLQFIDGDDVVVGFESWTTRPPIQLAAPVTNTRSTASV